MILKRMGEILKSAATSGISAAENYLPTSFNPELKTINSLAASLALLVMADREAEQQEIEDVSEFLLDMPFVLEKGLMREVSELFMKHVNTLETAASGSTMDFNVHVADMLKDIALIKDDVEGKKRVAETITLVTSGDAVDPREIKTRERILSVLK